MLILPAIDLLDGQCVRLTQGNYSEKSVYTSDALSVAKQFEEDGASWIHIVDLNGARTGEVKNLEIIQQIANACALKLEVGGGIRSLAVAKRVLEAGAERVVVGTKVIQDPQSAQEIFTALKEQAVAGLDARGGMVAVAGWTETSDSNVEQVAQWAEVNGAARIILTDISKDGMMQGPNLELLKRVLAATKIPVIQSGGIASLEDLESVAAISGRLAEGAIIGKAIYEKRLDLRAAIEKFQL